MMEERHGRRRSNVRRVLAFLAAADAFLLLICIILLIRGAVLEKKYEAATEEAGSTSADVIQVQQAVPTAVQSESASSDSAGDSYLAGVKALAEKGASAIDILKYLFPKNIVVADEGTYHFFDINSSLKKNTYPAANYSLSDNGTVSYSENGKKISMLGIDVSQHNGDIDWTKVRASGVDFAYIRAGIRGYGSGKLVEDTTYEANVTAARAAGLNVGVYFATQALNEDEAREEADYVLQLMAGKDINCPVAIDIEKIEEYQTTPRTKGLTVGQYTANVIAFCEEIKKAGYSTIIYGNAKTFTMMLDMSKVEDYEKWFADYITDAVYTPEFPYAFRIWQFSCKGRCDGVDGTCDYNIAYY